MVGYSYYVSLFRKAGIENAEGEFCEILSFVSDIPFGEIKKNRLISGNDGLFGADEKELRSYVEKRLSGVPVQYLTNKAYFYGREFYVDENVLIPRFDTECVIDVAIGHIFSSSKILDLCCGSGCIGITLCAEKGCECVFADVSENALSVTDKNARNILGHGVKTVRHDVFSDDIDGVFDLIISNPPYISDADMKTLDREVLHEPDLALRAGDGFDFYSVIPEKYAKNLADGGYLVFEVGYGQADEVCEICKNAGYTDVTVKNDYNGIKRAVSARFFRSDIL